MNKKLCLSTAALTLLSPFAAFADDPTGPTVWDGFSGWLSPDWSQDFSATVGVKIWINDWQRDSFIPNGIAVDDVNGQPLIRVDSSDTLPDNQESDIEPVPIPQISARYKWLFVTGSYYAKTGFDFDDSLATVTTGVDNGVCVPSLDCVQATTLVSTSGDRYEWDAAGGVYVHPYVAILGGYKKVRQRIDFLNTQTVEFISPSSPPLSAADRGFSDIDIEGPTIGIAGSVPIGRGFGIYASYAHGFMDAEISDDGAPDEVFDADYDVAEAGFSYTHGMDQLMPHLPLSAATVYAGYRYQNISTSFDEPFQDRADVTKGFAVGVNLSF